MNDRRLLQLLAAAVLTAAAVWVAMHTYWDYVMVDNPPQGEALHNRYYGFEHLGQALGVHTRQVPTLRALPAADGVLLVDDFRGVLLHIDTLETWVEGGGRVLLSRSALLSSPKLQSWSGIGIASPGSDDEDGAPRASRAAGLNAGLDDDCASYSERLAGRGSGKSLRACLGVMRVAFSSTRTPAWSLSNGYGFQMLRVDIGKGSIAVIACDCLMGKSLLRGDHARIVFDAIPLKAGDHVDILNPKNAEKLPALLWRLAASAIVCGLAAIGLTIWRNLPRFGRIAAPSPPLRRSLAEQLRARARFAWRARRLASLRRAERQALTQSACGSIAFYERMDAAQRIGALAARTGLDSGSLRGALSENLDGGAESQRTAIVVLERARRHLSH
jgi:hypothetical protein